MPGPERASIKALKRVQITARTRLLPGEQTYMTRRIRGEPRKVLVYGLDAVKAVEAAAIQLGADLRFEHLDQLKDRLWHLAERCHQDRRSDHVSAFVDEHAR